MCYIFGLEIPGFEGGQDRDRSHIVQSPRSLFKVVHFSREPRSVSSSVRMPATVTVVEFAKQYFMHAYCQRYGEEQLIFGAKFYHHDVVYFFIYISIFSFL